MNIDESIIKYYLKNVRFIIGTAYAGKSTMVKMLADRYGMIHCGENYHSKISDKVAKADAFPDLCYFETMKDWQEFVNRTPEEYERWCYEGQNEIAQFEIAELIHLAASGKPIIVDTNIPINILQKIADYTQVAVMLSPQSMSVKHFFDREDPEKQFLKAEIMKSKTPEATMDNFLECIARINSEEHYMEYKNSGFYTIIREDLEKDTREEVLMKLAKHFSLE